MHNEPSPGSFAPPPLPDPQTHAYPSSHIATGYLRFFLYGVLMLAVLFFMGRAIGLWPACILILGFYAFVSIYGTLRLIKLGKQLGYTVRTESDLALIRPEVNFNMKAAYLLMITIWPLLLASLFLAVWPITLLIIAVNLALTPFVTKCEKKFKAMSVVSDDPTLEARFQALLKQWQEPRFCLEKTTGV